ncbi:uncharacterized protein LAESUDRAFT_724824 [Laetiporus sulphureus 93-53]|uniref:Secreted protein n=1 Tax=Laetiporus sulphureus 93-53 TaxID=1314785 RepID=A0A165EMH2_9APHY|nr:uncharacterized protein LAESUDRAFT_724824 [Laetiporus sulphureus 93-53]KZT07370.1 hypothetical protein LAESUDRAFT_724824 [Laetiporus sulphureus 93-53]
MRCLARLLVFTMCGWHWISVHLRVSSVCSWKYHAAGDLLSIGGSIMIRVSSTHCLTARTGSLSGSSVATTRETYPSPPSLFIPEAVWCDAMPLRRDIWTGSIPKMLRSH